MKNKKSIIVICCPTYENMTEHDKKEIYSLLRFKEQFQAQKRGKKND